MEVFKDHRQVLNAILDSYFYNRKDEYMIEICEDVKNRLMNGEYRKPTEEGHIINGILTLLYGDYGTSPRYGWIENKLLIQEFVNILDDFIKECKDFIEEVNPNE